MLAPCLAAASTSVTLTVVPREDLADGQLVEILIDNAPARELLSLDGCVKLGDGLACSESGRGVRILPSGSYGPVVEKVRSILVTPQGRFDCREPGTSCLLALRAGTSVLATTPLSFQPETPLEAEPTLAVSPDAPLDDGQTVHVRGSGFDVSIHTGVRQCKAGTLDPGDCRPSGRAPITSDTGTLRQDVMAYAGFGTVYDEWVDCSVPASCELVVFSGRADGAPVRTPLAFAGPRVAAPSIAVTPGGPLTDGQVLTVSGSGFVPDAPLSLEQYVVRDASKPSRWRLLIANGFVGTSSSGTFTTQIVVRTSTGDGAPLCSDAASPCLLVAREAQGRYGVARATLAFR
ncbi:MAG: neocarzinostatin apoprotein domain-containing protein [Polyangiales bacterium]